MKIVITLFITLLLLGLCDRRAIERIESYIREYNFEIQGPSLLPESPLPTPTDTPPPVVTPFEPTSEPQNPPYPGPATIEPTSQVIELPPPGTVESTSAAR